MHPKNSEEPGTLDPRLSSPRLPSAPPVGRSKYCGFRDFADLVDKWLSGSCLGRLFRLADSGHVSTVAFLFCHRKDSRETGRERVIVVVIKG